MARLRTVGWETQRLTTTSSANPEANPGGGGLASSMASAGPGAIDTTVPRSGLACFAAAGASQYEEALALGAVLGRAYYQRIGFRFTATQASNQPIMDFLTTGAALISRTRLTSGDLLQFTNATVQVGADSPVLTHDKWYRLEMKAVVHAVPTSSNGILEARLYDDATGALIWNPSSSSVDLLSTAVDRGRVGNAAVNATVGTIYVDDWAINDDTGAAQTSWPGNGKIVLLKPVSDNARVGWTGGAGGTTNLKDAVDNTPLVGLSAASGTDASQIKNPNNNATDTYDADVGAYSDSVASGGGGMVSGDVVSVVQAVCRMGNSTTTARTIGVNNQSNPVGTERTQTNAAVAAGTDPTGYYSIRNNPQYAPSVTLATKPVVRVRKGTASTDVMVVDLMGLYVEYVPVTIVPLSASAGVSSATLGLTAPTQIPLDASAGASSSSLALTAPTKVPVSGAFGVGSATLALAAPTQVSLATSAGVGLTSLVLAAPTRLPISASSGIGGASLALTAQTQIALGVSAGVASPTLALNAPALIALSSSGGVASSSLALAAPTLLSLLSTGVASTSLLLSAPTQVLLGSSDGSATTALVITGPTAVALQASAGIASALLALTSPTQVPLGSSSGQASTSLALSATTRILLATATGSASTSLQLGAATLVPLDVASGSAAPTLALTALTRIALGTAAGAGNASLVLDTPTVVPLDPASGLALASLALSAPIALQLGPANGVASASLLLSVITQLQLAAASGIGTGSLLVTSPTQVPLDPSSGVGSATLIFHVGDSTYALLGIATYDAALGATYNGNGDATYSSDDEATYTTIAGTPATYGD